jgi:hypothetical protein
MATVAEWPSYITDMYMTGLEENDAGIYGIRFFIRGKPWVVSIDNKLGFKQSYNSMRLTGTNRENMGSSMWAPVMEKAWAKVKGSFQIAGSGGMTSNGIRAIMGIPVLRYDI